jgi:pSer/pThr/pTyr-binding forkhead associated (FHA) protein
MSLFKDLAAAVGRAGSAAPQGAAPAAQPDKTMRMDPSKLNLPPIAEDEDDEVTHMTLAVAASRPVLRYVAAPPGSPERFFVSATGVTTIGRAPDNDIVLANTATSGHHCRIDQKDKTFTLVDLGATNRTQVNCKEVETAVLRNGDKISIGDATLVFSLFGNRT